MPSESRRLSDLGGVGRATVKDFEILGVSKVSDLGMQDPEELYQRLCRITGVKHHVCCLDVLH